MVPTAPPTPALKPDAPGAPAADRPPCATLPGVRAVSRRTFLALGATVVVAGCSGRDGGAPPTSRPEPSAPPTGPAPTSPPTAAATTAITEPATTPPPATAPPTTAPLAADPFTLGVAAGDPDEASAVLWTRLTGEGLPDAVAVAWEVARDEGFADVVGSGTATAHAADGHALHVVAALEGPAWYRFHAGGFTSRLGRAAPAPAAAGELRVAAASCQHFETGFYAAHRDVAEWSPDLVVFLGDFIYEGAARPVGGDVVRSHDGPEPTDVAGYRARYAHYLSDGDLQASRAACPWLVVWDDHEVENNYAGLVPQEPTEAAAFPARRDAAYRAWWEHMPVRLPAPSPGAPYPIARTVAWGGLADLVLLDGRQFRSDQACGAPTLSLDPPCPEAADPARTMLGPDQETWTGEALAASSATWATVCQQTVLTDLRFNGAILNYDQWDGYAPARDRLLAQAAAVERLVVLTGDIHLAGVGVLPGLGVEFVTTSISSMGNVDASLQPILDSFATVAAAELTHRGYTRHTVTPTRWSAEYRIVENVADPASAVATWRTFHVDATARDLVATT